jgi:hypothetical protein
LLNPALDEFDLPSLERQPAQRHPVRFAARTVDVLEQCAPAGISGDNYRTKITPFIIRPGARGQAARRALGLAPWHRWQCIASMGAISPP